VAGIPVDDRTVIVQVDEMLAGPADLQIPAGSQVTVQLAPELPPLGVGDRAAFFSNGLAYGENIAVAETGRMPLEQGLVAAASGDLTAAIEKASTDLVQDDVFRHAQAVPVIVLGQVVSLTAAPHPASPGEHDPNWWIATLAVDRVVKDDVGRAAGDTLAVLYANSLDIRWSESPKPKAAQSGLWLLHETAEDNRGLAPVQMLHPIDLQPSLQLEFLQARGL
jgi:hypothetical protein